MLPGISAKQVWLPGKQHCPVGSILYLGFLDPPELQKGMGNGMGEGGHTIKKPGCRGCLVLCLRDT